MSKFKYGNFYSGDGEIDFVANAKKYTKEQTINLCLVENNKLLKTMPTICDVKLHYMRWSVGYYSYCEKSTRGSFPVWVIKLKDLEDGKCEK